MKHVWLLCALAASTGDDNNQPTTVPEPTGELESVFAAASVARAREAVNAEHDTLQRLLQAAGYRDDNTYEHTQRVGLLAAKPALAIGLATAPLLYVVWANSRFSLRPALPAAHEAPSST